MAKRTTSSKALGYQESFFANRNDMLQSALDAVLLKIDNEQARYEAEVELYKEASKLVTREKERLQKLVDNLKKDQLDKNQAVAQFNAGQLNSTARTSAGIEAANARFNAKQAALAAFYGTRGFSAGRNPSDQVTLNEIQIAYNNNPNDINAAFRAYDQQVETTAGVGKSVNATNKAKAELFDYYVRGESQGQEYAAIPDPADRIEAARAAKMAELSKIDQGNVELGMILLDPTKAAGAGLSIDSSGNVSVGGIDTKTVGQVDYSGLIADAEARLGRIKEAGAKAPVAPEEPDLIDLQRREYFDKFYSGYVPRYEMNEIMQKLIDLPDREAQAFKDLYQSRYAPVAGMETPTGARRVRDLPTTPGGVIGGEGSPFVPTDRFSAKGREILGNIPSNQFYIEDMDDPTEAGLQERANLLFREGFGLQKTLKEDGRILYTVVPFDQLGQYPADQVVMPSEQAPETVESLTQQINALRKEIAAATAGAAGGLSPFNIFASIAGEEATADVGMQSLAGKQAALDSLLEQRFALETKPSSITPQQDMRIAQQNVRMGEGAPFNPAKYDAEILALTSDLDRIATNLAFLKESAVSGTPEYDESRRLESEYAVKDELLNDLLMRRGNMQAKVDGAGIEPKKEYPITGDQAEVRRIQPTTALPARRRAPMDYDQSEIIPFNLGGGPVEITEDTLDLGGGPVEITEDTLDLGGGPVSDEPSLDLDSDAGFEELIQERGVKAIKGDKKPNPKVTYEDLSPEEIEAAEETRRKEYERARPTPEQTDAKVKFNAAEKAQSIYGTPEFNKLLNTELGKAVSDLYSVNKAKGDETGGEILSYIATEFPRAEDQSKAAQILMGLSYADKTKGLLKA